MTMKFEVSVIKNLSLRKCGFSLCRRLYSTIKGTIKHDNRNTQHNKNYCANLVRKYDWEGYIATLLMPKSCINSVFSVKAFNVELAQIASNTSQDIVSKGRYIFWGDVLDALYKDSPHKVPVAQELYQAIRKHNLSKIWLSRMIESREAYSKRVEFQTVDEIETYADNTSTAILCLTLQCLGINDVEADHIASHVGKAHGIMTVLRSTLFFSKNNMIRLPYDLLIKHKVSQEQILRCQTSENLLNLTHELASQAKAHLEHARSINCKKKNVHKAFLITAAIDWYLTELEKKNFDIFNSSLQQRNGLLPLSIFKLNIRKKF